MWAALILSPFNGFSSRNRREVPRRVPHRRLSAHRRPPIALALPPPGRHVARGGGLRGRYNLLSRYFQTISLFHRAASHNPLPAGLAVRRIPAICYSRPPILSARRIATQFALPSWCHCTAPSGSPLPKAIGAASGEATFAAKIYLAARISFRSLRRCDRERRLDLQNQTIRIA
jgi:hypothetical protein